MQTNLFSITETTNVLLPKNEREKLLQRFLDKLVLNPHLTRSLVSFQENKNEPFYRWLKYKEGFSSKLVQFFLDHYKAESETPLRILDPFAGTGTTVTTAINKGHLATGIELMPVGTAAMRARLCADTVHLENFQKYYHHFLDYSFTGEVSEKYRFKHLNITGNAFPEETEKKIAQYLEFVDHIHDEEVKYLFWFACLTILEEVSFTSKDGQYLRWDLRSNRKLKSQYQKRHIEKFTIAIKNKLEVIYHDLKKRNGNKFHDKAKIIEGSCLDELMIFPSDSIDVVITSPPYCNRYDYTRTYALELAFLGFDELAVKNLRQALLTATVENKSKKELMKQKYAEISRLDFHERCVDVFNNQKALQEVLGLLYEAQSNGLLNNKNIPNMVENYFYEMNFLIQEMGRIVSADGRIYMVNDNVQYNGTEVPVDLILSEFARSAGFAIDTIWILPRGKGNSSQQMGAFGRTEIRKCVYVWSKVN